MNLESFSIEFDILYNNIASNMAPGLNKYEKSVFLTQAQEAIVQDFYAGTSGLSFEETEAIRQFLSVLVRQTTYHSEDEVPRDAGEHIVEGSVFFDIDSECWFKTWEGATIEDSSLECSGSSERKADVYPVTQDTFYRTYNSPFRGPNERRVLRLDYGKNGVELVSKYPITSYSVRYVRKPKPLILEELPSGLEINGETEPSDCEFPESLHRTILLRAVSIAKAVWSSGQSQQ